MGIFNIFKREAPKQEQQSHVVPASPTSEPVPYDSPLLFNLRGNHSAFKLSAVYAAISLISNSIASLPVYVKQRKENENTVVANSPIQKLFYSMLQSKHTVIKQIVVDLLLWGNAFIYIKRGQDDRPEKLVYLQHGDVQVDYQKQIDLLQYNVCNHKGIPSIVKKEDMLHFAKDTLDGVNGRGFMFFASDIIELAGATQRAASDYFGSGCNLSGILQFNGRLTDAQKASIRAQWQQLHGTGVSGGLGVLEGDSKYTPLSQNASDSQMIETREFNVVEIARFFNLNPVMLGDLSHSSYNSIEEAQIEFITHSLLPLINLIEEEIDRKLITIRNQYIDFDESYLLRGNKSSLADYYTKLVSNAIITVDEARESLGYNPMNTDYSSSLIIPFTKIEDNVLGDKQSSDEEKITPDE